MPAATERVVTFGASVRGPQHRSLGTGNEDAWDRRGWRRGAVITVADGVGSRSHARDGAVAACRAAVAATRQAIQAGQFEADVIIRELEADWERSVLPISALGDAATTCLWAVKVENGPLQVAQAGDGLAAVRWPDGNLEVLAKREGFLNETDALGLSRSPTWHCLRAEDVPVGTAVLLTTDGISDDLVPARLSEFIEYLSTEFGSLDPHQRWRALCSELTTWPTPHHLDDKTLAMMLVSP